MPKPGVMFYFEVRPCLKRLNLEEKGQLFEAILDYGEFGIEPSLDGMAGLAWDFLQPKLDRDATRYDRQIEQKQYAVYVRESKKKNVEPLSFDDWKTSHGIGEEQPISSDIGKYPNLILQTTNPILQTDIKADRPPSRPRFSPPTVDEVRAYCTEKGYPLDADRFVDYYTSNGWKVGKNPMKDWKAAVRTWNRKDNPKGNSVNPMPNYGGEGNWSL